jgi:hypothetical protein
MFVTLLYSSYKMGKGMSFQIASMSQVKEEELFTSIDLS